MWKAITLMLATIGSPYEDGSTSRDVYASVAVSAKASGKFDTEQQCRDAARPLNLASQAAAKVIEKENGKLRSEWNRKYTEKVKTERLYERIAKMKDGEQQPTIKMPAPDYKPTVVELTVCVDVAGGLKALLE